MKRNEGNAEIKGGNATNGMGMQVRGILAEMQKMWESGWRYRELRWKLKYSGRTYIAM